MDYIGEQIMKALEDAVICVGQAPFVEKVAKGEQLKSDIIDLIKRLKTDNERLNSLCTSKDVIINDLNAKNAEYKSEHKGFVKKLGNVASLNTLLFDRKNELESQARKEFAERLKDECSGNPYLDDYVLNKCIDNLLEEMEK